MEEPKRKSFLDVFKGHLNLADRFTHITRFVYIGEYKGSKDDLQKKMKINVKELNEEYGEVVFTGFLLVYPGSFLHVIEASEETIYRHLQTMFVSNFEDILGRVIYLPPYHDIYKLYFSGWYGAFVNNPPVLLSNIENIELDEIHSQIKNCLFKIYSLSEYLMDIGFHSQQKLQKNLKNLDKIVPHYLPEVTIVDYILSVKSSLLEDLRDYSKKFIKIPFVNFYNDRIWPPSRSLVPSILNLDETDKKAEDQR